MIPEIDHPTLAEHLAAGNAVVVDVREAHEFLPGHVPGAVNVPLAALPARLRELPRDRRIWVICNSGNRGAQATPLLRALGVDAANVAGGTEAWIASGRPLEIAAQPEGAER